MTALSSARTPTGRLTVRNAFTTDLTPSGATVATLFILFVLFVTLKAMHDEPVSTSAPENRAAIEAYRKADSRVIRQCRALGWEPTAPRCQQMRDEVRAYWTGER